VIRRPRFDARFHVEIVKGEGVFLVSETGHAVLTGPIFERVVPLITGRRTSDAIVAALDRRVSAAEVYYALTLLERRGYIVEHDHQLPPAEAALWSIQSVDPAAAAGRLASATVAITALAPLTAAPMAALLKTSRVRVDATGEVGIVLTDDYLRTELTAYNLEALRANRPWLLAKPVGGEIWIGPFFKPGQPGCWECLARRLRLNRAVETFVQQLQHRTAPFPISRASVKATRDVACGIAATEVVSWIARGGASTLEGGVLSIAVPSWRTERHQLTPQTDCPACGAGATVPAAPRVWLQSRRKVFTDDGGHRTVTPDETLRKYAHHVSPITGAVQGLHRHLSGGDGVMHVYSAGENFAVPPHNLLHLRRSLRSRSSGKGVTDVQAKASALCEALERYSGVFRGTEPRRGTTLSQLGGLGIHPNECMRFSDRQYDERDEINARGIRFYRVPMRFDDQTEVEWTPVWSLTHDVERYLPTEACYYAYPSSTVHRYCVGCSNGSAAGNTLEEAILQGFLELVERDSVALWWYSRVRRPGVDVMSFDEPFIAKLITFLRERRRELWVLDLTSDLRIPVFVAMSRRTDRPEEHIAMGFGAHLDPRIALLRAITELNQALVSVLADDEGSEEPPGLEDSQTKRWLQTATLANQPYLAADAGAPLRPASAFVNQATDDIRDDLVCCRKIVEGHGMEMLVLDQTRPDVGLPVAKVFVPGLRHFWARFAPGRLYDVPLALGWVERRLAEGQLNPIPMFL
jgi:oxazoline/thiazoline synthase